MTEGTKVQVPHGRPGRRGAEAEVGRGDVQMQTVPDHMARSLGFIPKATVLPGSRQSTSSYSPGTLASESQGDLLKSVDSRAIPSLQN